MNFWYALHRVLDFLFCDRCILEYMPSVERFCPLQPLWNIVGDATDPRGRLPSAPPPLFPKSIMSHLRDPSNRWQIRLP